MSPQTRKAASRPRRSRATKLNSTNSFTLFPRLPPEIRQEIWRLALLSAMGAGVCLLPSRFTARGRAKLIVRLPREPIRAACSESQTIARRDFPLSRPFDPDTDILYVGASAFENFCSICVDESWPGQVRHLAIALPVADSGHWLPASYAGGGSRLPLTHLDQLKVISIVYPKSTGEVDFHGTVAVPKQQGQILREFSSKEMLSFKINADYWPSRDYHAVWTQNTKQHLSSINHNLSRQGREERPQCWDSALRRLKFKLEARYFAISK